MSCVMPSTLSYLPGCIAHRFGLLEHGTHRAVAALNAETQLILGAVAANGFARRLHGSAFLWADMV